MNATNLDRRRLLWADLWLVLTLLRDEFASQLISATELEAKLFAAKRTCELQGAVSRAKEGFDHYEFLDGGRVVHERVAAIMAQNASVPDGQRKRSVLLALSLAIVGEFKKSLDPLRDALSLTYLTHIESQVTNPDPKIYASVRNVAAGLVTTSLALTTAKVRRKSIPAQPGRDSQLRVADTKSYVKSPDVLRHRLFSQAYSTEIPAAEVCAMMLIRFRDMPDKLQADLAQQVWDEMRHAEMLLEQARGMNFDASETDIHLRIWEGALHASTIGEAIAIEHVLGEGYGIGNDLFLAHHYERHRRSDLAQIHIAIHADETNHVFSGIKWFHRLLGAQSDLLLDVLEKELKPAVLGGRWFLPQLRKKVGFTEKEVLRQRKLARPKTLKQL